jgi:hypothetical protein
VLAFRPKVTSVNTPEARLIGSAISLSWINF